MKQRLVAFLFFLFSCAGILVIGCNDNVPYSESKNTTAYDSLVIYYGILANDETKNLQEKLQLNQKAFKLALSVSDSFQLKLIAQRAGFHRKLNQLDSTLYYSQKLLEKAKELQDSVYQAEAYFRLGFYHRLNNDLGASLSNYYQAKEMYSALGDSINAGRKILNLANLLNLLGNYNEAETSAVEGLTFLENKGDQRFIAGLYNALAISTKEQKNYADALFWYDKALKVNSDSIIQINIVNNKAAVYTLQEKFGAAEALLEALLRDTLLLKEENLQTKARVLDNLGVVHSKTGNPSAEKELLESYAIRQQLNYVPGIFNSYVHLAEHYQGKNQNKSLDMATKAYQTSLDLENPDDIMAALGLLIEVADNPKLYAQRYKTINDSITIVRQEAKNQFAKIRYESEKNLKNYLEASNETSIKSLQLAKSRNRNIILLASLLLIVISGVFSYRLLQTRHTRLRIKESYDTEARIAKRVHDELANDVFNLLNFAESKNLEAPQEKEALLDNLDGIYSKTRDISKNIAAIDTGQEYPMLLHHLLSGYGNQHCNVLIKGLDQIPWHTINDIKKIACYRVLQELMINMKKHSIASLVLVEFKKEGKHIYISYSDNGVGITNIKAAVKSGLHNAENRIAAIKGTFTFETKEPKGFKSRIAFPI